MLVALSQLFGATMNLSARLLELEGEGMHPVQMLLIRQGVTSICCLAYMRWMNIANFPFGNKDIRWLLLARGCTGFFGIFGMWWSMMYLPLADATVITFLAPGVAGLVCYFLLKEPFTRLEQLATLVALLGVVLIAQPVALFARNASPEAKESANVSRSSLPGADHETTPQERLLAVGVALLGVCGAAGAFTTLRAIGRRAHPLISVNAFAMICTVVCATALGLGPALDIGQPSLRWISPTSVKQWLLLLSLGGLGFVMQYLLTAGLAADKSNRANAMVYTHMLFAASFDRWIFHHRMGLMSFAGCALILGSAVGVIFMKEPAALPKIEDVERQNNLSGEAEGSPMLVGVAGHDGVNLERIR
jgi:drug/metabolite transporter (DMT)-like permease